MAGTADKAGGMSGCRKSALIGLAILVGAIGFVWWRWYPSYTYHQKITVTVEAGGKDYSASSVTAVTWRFFPPILTEGKRATATLQGEAVHLKLPGGKHLFAVLKIDPPTGFRGNGWTRDMNGLATYVFPEAVTQLYWPPAVKKLRETREIPEALRPWLVTFDDLSKPESVRKVNPWSLGSTFGAGVELKSMTLAITDEPVGPGMIEATLLWLREYRNKMLDGQRNQTSRAPDQIANSLSAFSFSTENGR